jgi:hypothetical protein
MKLTMRSAALQLPLLSLLLVLSPGPASAIVINLLYEVPDVSKPEVVRAFTQAEMDVIDQARDFWELHIDSAEVFGIDCAVVDLPGSRLGEANPDPADPMGTPVGGRILIDTRTGIGQKPFFVDPTPDENSEYQPVQATTPAAFATGDPASPAFDKFDLLTVAIHELGHVLGISSSYVNSAMSLQPSPDTHPNQKVYVFGGSAALGDPVADYKAGVFFTDGAIYVPASDEDPEEGGSTGGDPSHLDDVDFGGGAAGLFPLNVMNESLLVSERFLIAEPELDVLADAYAYTVVPEPGPSALAAAAIATLATLCERRRRAAGARVRVGRTPRGTARRTNLRSKNELGGHPDSEPAGVRGRRGGRARSCSDEAGCRGVGPPTRRNAVGESSRAGERRGKE